MIAMALVCHPLVAQGRVNALLEVMGRYSTIVAAPGDEEVPVPALKGGLDDLGRVWAAWVVEELNRSRQPTDLPAALSECVPKGNPGIPMRMQLESRRQDWLLLSLEVPVPCGSHSMLALLRKTGDRWKLAILDAPDRLVPANELGAREHLQVQLLEGPRVVIASTPPWCTSCWSRIDVRVVRPGPAVDTPSLDRSNSIRAYRCQDYVFKLERAGTNRLRIRYFKWAGPERIFSPAVATLDFP